MSYEPFSIFICVAYIFWLSIRLPAYFNLHESHGRDFTACFMKPLDGFSQWFLTEIYNGAK